MSVAGLIVGASAPLQRIGDRLFVDDPGAGGFVRRRSGEFERAERDARIAVRKVDQRLARARLDPDVRTSQSPLGIAQRTIDQYADIRVVERFEHEDARTREQSRIDLERGVLGGRADQRDGAVLDVRQDGVLLRFVEPVDLVDEQDGALAGGAELLRVGDDAPQVGDARTHRRELREVCAGEVRDDLRERRLARAGRAPKDHRGNLIALDRAPQRTARPHDLFLTDELVERARPHARRERVADRTAASARLEEPQHSTASWWARAPA